LGGAERAAFGVDDCRPALFFTERSVPVEISVIVKVINIRFEFFKS
jgi:hypothetical protein